MILQISLEILNIFSFTLSSFKLIPRIKKMIQASHFIKKIMSIVMAQARSILDIPIFHKIYDLYKLLDSYQNRIPKSQRYTLWQKCENTTLELLEALLE